MSATGMPQKPWPDKASKNWVESLPSMVGHDGGVRLSEGTGMGRDEVTLKHLEHGALAFLGSRTGHTSHYTSNMRTITTSARFLVQACMILDPPPPPRSTGIH